AAFPPPDFTYFHRMQSIRLGGFQPPCPKATEVHTRLASTSCKKQREHRFLYLPSNIRYCGSRVFNTLVGHGAKPRRNPLLALKSILKNIIVNSYVLKDKSKRPFSAAANPNLQAKSGGTLRRLMI
ncbi:MAG: hypothetical protein Q4G00_10060, partial [Clostridia bacterium]|nr:hypothetical protein [Clostridia bacterium]